METLESIIKDMLYYGYIDNNGLTATYFMAVGEDSEFGTRALVLLRKLKEEEFRIRLDQTKKVFEALTSILKEGSCSYRALIYDKLGFTPECYEELIAGMNITNAFVLLEDYKENNVNSVLLDSILEEVFNDKGNL